MMIANIIPFTLRIFLSTIYDLAIHPIAADMHGISLLSQLSDGLRLCLSRGASQWGSSRGACHS